MTESEKMVALKKAYADIILNTAKEAAIRFMASEKKALRSQHDLFAAKDEALRLLVHLKQMIDAKTIEAEILSSSQQTKIDELEAQLQEAESVIVDLRAELVWVRDKLEKVRTNPLNGKIIGDGSCYQDATLGSNIFSPQLGLQPLTISDMNNTLFDQRKMDIRYSNAEQTQHLIVSQFGSASHDTELASVMKRNKEPELHRNGCTQRICEVKKNSLAGKVVPEEFDKKSLTKSEMVTRESNKDCGGYTLPPPMTKNFSGEEVRKRVKIYTSRRRTHFGKLKAKRRSCPSQLMKPYQLPSILSRCKRHLVNVNAKPDECSLHSIKTDDVDLNNHSSKMGEKLHCQNSCIVDEKMSVHEEEKQWEVQSRDASSTSCTSYADQNESCLPPSLLSHHMPCSHTLHGNINAGKDQSWVTKNEVKLKQLPRLDPALTLIRGGLNPLSGSANPTVSVKTLNQSCNIQNTANKGMELADELVNQECQAAANTTFPCHASNPVIVNVPLVYSDLKDLKASKEGSVHVSLVHSDMEDAKTSKELTSTSLLDNNRLLKYTFQRKRKKEASSSPDQNTSLEKNTVKRRAGGKENDSLKLQKSSMIESSRVNQRLVQVACQLISMSRRRRL